MTKSLKAISLTLATLIALSGSAYAEVTVTTGAGYIKMVEALTHLYEQKTGVKVHTAFGGNIGQMLAQVKEGSGVNVVISDDATLKKFSTLLSANAGVALGSTPLVLIWRKGLTLQSPQDIVRSDVRSLAYPDPKAAIYGRAAQAWLQATGLDKKVAPKVNQVSTVPQVFSYVATGDMDAGFVNVLAWRAGAQKVGGHFEINDDAARINMVARPVKGFEKDTDVRAFLGFLSSADAKPLLKRFGVE